MSLKLFIYQPWVLHYNLKKKKKFTSLNPIMCFLYCAWMNFSQIRNWNSKWDRWETLGPSETKSRPRQSWLQQSCFSTQPTKYDQKKKGGGGGQEKSTKTYPHLQQLYFLEFNEGCCIARNRKFSPWILSQGSFIKWTIINAPFPNSAYRIFLFFITA